MVLVIDFGSQYTELIIRKIRENNVFADVKFCTDADLIQIAKQHDALVISGSHCCAKDELHEKTMQQLISLNKPMLCICYGMQVIHKIMGGKVEYDALSEFGETQITSVKHHSIIDGIPFHFKMWMSHKDSVSELAPGFSAIAKTKKCYSIAANDIKKIYTLQFHPEIDHEKHGGRIIANFLFLICRLKSNWHFENIKQQKIEQIKETVGNGKVFLAVSGGIDSSVASQLIERADVKAKYIFVKTGLFCYENTESKIAWLTKTLGEKLIIVDAEERFLRALENVVSPEEKRKKIGSLFVKIFKEIIEQEDEVCFLAQGTIKSDVIESGKNKQDNVIKTHHNMVGELKQQFKIIEPLEDLFKDEIKKMAKELDIPEEIINSKPFPGVGYAIRILGEVTKEKIEIIREGDQILFEILRKNGFYEKISQCFTTLINHKSVGVAGDQRNYGYIMGIRSVNTENMMCAKISDIPTNVLMEISAEIINRIPQISRVVYDITTKPPATIEWE